MTTKPLQPWSYTIVQIQWSKIDYGNSKEGTELVTNCNQLKMVSTKESVPQVLLIERGADPYKGCWAFPGGFMNMDETTEQCAIRELEEETGLQVTNLHQIGAYSKVDRDPRGRTITIAYARQMRTCSLCSRLIAALPLNFNVNRLCQITSTF